jgi:hypothetical protein
MVKKVAFLFLVSLMLAVWSPVIYAQQPILTIPPGDDQIVPLGEPFRVTVDGRDYVIEEGQLAHPYDRCRIAPVTRQEAIQRGLLQEADDGGHVGTG